MLSKPNRLTPTIRWRFRQGRNVTGQVVTMDLTKMPHLLIAGATGGGKSVAINDIITSMLMNARPDQLKLMIDPKKVELSVQWDSTFTNAGGFWT